MKHSSPFLAAQKIPGKYKNSKKGSIDKNSIGQNEDFEMKTFDDIANVVVGSHWTEFSNEYGSCAPDVGTSTDPAKR